MHLPACERISRSVFACTIASTALCCGAGAPPSCTVPSLPMHACGPRRVVVLQVFCYIRFALGPASSPSIKLRWGLNQSANYSVRTLLGPAAWHWFALCTPDALAQFSCTPPPGNKIGSNQFATPLPGRQTLRPALAAGPALFCTFFAKQQGGWPSLERPPLSACMHAH